MGKTRSINKIIYIHIICIQTLQLLITIVELKQKNRNIYGFSPIRGIYIMGELVQEIINLVYYYNNLLYLSRKNKELLYYNYD